MSEYYRIGEFARLIQKSSQTLRNWDKNGILKPAAVDHHGRKLYSKEQLDHILNQQERQIIGYCRVNRYRQSDELAKQAEILKEYMERHHYQYQMISEFGSGLKYNRKGLRDVLRMLAENRVAKIIAVQKDSLVRYGNELIETLCRIHGCELIYLRNTVCIDDYCDDMTSMIKTFESTCKDKGKQRMQVYIHQT